MGVRSVARREMGVLTGADCDTDGGSRPPLNVEEDPRAAARLLASVATMANAGADRGQGGGRHGEHAKKHQSKGQEAEA